MPPWINEQPPEDVLWGIGVASEQAINMRMTMADARARASIAGQLQTMVQGMINDFQKEAGGVNTTAALSFAETVNRQLTQANLQGAVPDVRWTTPDNKTLWVRMKMSKADAAKVAAAEVGKVVESEASLYAEFKAMNSLEKMDAALDKYASDPNPVIK
jgi:hypothetical protein